MHAMLGKLKVVCKIVNPLDFRGKNVILLEKIFDWYILEKIDL